MAYRGIEVSMALKDRIRKWKAVFLLEPAETSITDNMLINRIALLFEKIGEEKVYKLFEKTKEKK